MVIGVAPGSIRGVPPIEILEIDKIVSRYIGAAGPRWDLVRVPVSDSTNEVLVIVVDPPVEGQDPFLCRRDGEGLTDGAIYIRADGATREAKADEVELLLQRGKHQIAPEVAFEVAIDGVAHPIDVNRKKTIDVEIARVKQRLFDALPQPEPEPDTSGAETTTTASLGHPLGASHIASSAFSDMMKPHTSALAGMAAELAKVQRPVISSMITTEPEKRTEDQYRASIAKWETRFGEKWPSAVDALAGRLLEGVTLRIKNPTKTFFHDVEVKIHLEGAVRGVERISDEHINRSDLDLPTAPRSWGPVSRSMFDTGPHFPGAYLPANYSPSTYRSPLDWRNSGSIDLRLDVGELRPREDYVFDDQEIVLVLPSDHEATIQGTWEITARDHNEIYTGTLEVQTGKPVDLTAALRKLLDIS